MPQEAEFTQSSFKAGNQIFDEGDKGDNLYLDGVTGGSDAPAHQIFDEGDKGG